MNEWHAGFCEGQCPDSYPPATDITLDGGVAGPAIGQPCEGFGCWGSGQAGADKVHDVSADTKVPEQGRGLKAEMGGAAGEYEGRDNEGGRAYRDAWASTQST